MNIDEPYEISRRESLSMSSSMLSQELSQIRIAVVSNSVSQRNQLKEALENVGLKIVINEPLTFAFIDLLTEANIDVIILDLDEHGQYDDILDKLLDNHAIPIIFNDVSVLTLNEPQVLARWYGKLLKKISSAVGQHSIEEETFADHYSNSSKQKAFIEGQGKNTPTSTDKHLAKNVWVLGASLGGPDAVKEFFKALPTDIPVAFILTQHLGANFISILADQLDKITDYKVLTPELGHVIKHGEVIVTPVDKRLTVNPIGAIGLDPITEEQQYSPSINMVLEDMLERYGKKMGTIIFSGMGDDGLKGAKLLHSKGSMIWTQSAESCVISSMPGNITDKGFSSFSGTPAKLAEKLYDYLREN